MYLAQDKTLLARESNSNHSHQIQITHIKFRFTVKLRNRGLWRKAANGGNISEMFTVFCHLNHLCTVAHNCHIKTKCSQSDQVQITHIKFKSLTSNSNHSQQIHSQQIKITHSKLQITHSKLQIVHIKYKSFTHP